MRKGTKKGLSLLTLSLLILGSLIAVIPAIGAQNGEETSHLTVYVFDSIRNLPLEGANVEIHLTDVNGTVLQNLMGITNSNGTVRFEITPGMVTGGITKDGYEATRVTLDATGGDPDYHIRALLVPMDKPPEMVELTIWPVSVDGQTVAGAVAVIKNIETGDIFKEESGEGRPVHLRLPQGIYEIELNARGYEPAFMTVEIFDTEKFEITMEMVPVEEQKFASVQVFLLSPRSDMRVWGGTVEMMNLETGEMFIGETGDDDNVMMEVTWGKYHVMAWAPDFGKAEGEFAFFDEEWFEIELVLAGGEEPEREAGRIEGKVLGGEEKGPIAGAVVYIKTEFQDPNNNVDHNGEWFENKVMTDERGFFEFDRVPAGMCAITIHCEGFHEMNDKVSVEPGETTFLEFYLKPCNDHPEPEMMLVTGNVQHAVNGDAVPGVEVLFFRDEWVQEHKPEFERRPIIIFKYFDENSDGNPEIMLLEADFDGDKRTDLHYVYIDENSDGNPEEIAIEASYIPWDFQMDLPGMQRYLNMMGGGCFMGNEEECWDEECPDADGDEIPDDLTRGDDGTSGEDGTSSDEDREKEEREKEGREKEEQEKQEREREEKEKEEREKEGQEKEEREKEEREKEEREKEREKEEQKERNPDNRPKDSFVAKTDREGSFELKMPAGEYTVVVEAKGFLPYKEHFSIYHMVEPKPDGNIDDRPEFHLNIDLLPEDFDPQFMGLPPGEVEDAKGGNEKADINARIREFMDDDSYEMDIEPFKELVSDNGESAETGEKEDDGKGGTGTGGESKGSFLEGEYSAEGLITGGVAIALMTLLLIFVIVTKKRNKKTGEDLKDERSEPEEKSMKPNIVRKRPRPKVRTVQLKRRKITSQ